MAETNDTSGEKPALLVGYPGTFFTQIHGTALGALALSMVASVVIITTLLLEKPRCDMRKKKQVERFVIYLQTCDLLFNITHMSDHAYIFYWKAYPPHNLCLAFAFVLQQFLLGTSLVTLSIAANTFVMVVMEKRLSFGRFDWRVWLVPMGIPLVFGITGVAIPYFGPAGAW